jgi:hypothetical protein
MKKINIVLLGILFLVGCNSNRLSLRNTTIVYLEEKNDSLGSSNNFNTCYIVTKDDTIIKVNHPYGFHYDSLIGKSYRLLGEDTVFKDVFVSVPPQSEVPYKFSKKGKTIYIEYNSKEKRIKEPYYSLIRGQRFKIFERDNICSRGFAVNNGFSEYSGRDTTLRIYGKSLDCWIFFEMYPSHKYGFENQRKQVYLEKRDLVPLIEILQVFSDTAFKLPTWRNKVQKLNFLIENNEETFKRVSCDK